MTPERFQRIKELFRGACEATEPERGAFLDRECGDDDALCAEVESLLAIDRDEAGGVDDDLLHQGIARELLEGIERCGDDHPERIGRYRVLRLIASGGMGTVYEAVQDQPQRPVALKVLKGGVASRSALRRFALEAEILGRLRHPGIAQIYEAGTHDGGAGPVPYFAMEFVPNARTIIAYADDERLSLRQRLILFSTVCEAVEHGHQRGIVHRDLKPSNILVDRSGRSRVIDFGVARTTDADIAATAVQTGVDQFVGTLCYMSPEQCGADSTEIDTRSDVYALGVTLYELLCGRLPYDLSRTAPFEIPRVIREEDPHRLSSIDRSLRGDVETIVLKALEKDRGRRYQSVAELARDLRRFLDNEPIEARRDRGWYVLGKTLSRYRVAVAVACLFLLISFASAVAFGVLYRSADAQRSLAEQRAEALRRTAYRATIVLAQNAHENQNTLNLVQLLDECPLDLRGWEWKYLKRACDTSMMSLRGHEGWIYVVAVSPDGRRIVSGSHDRTLKLWDTADGTLLRTLRGHETFVRCAAFSPDGAFIASGGFDEDGRVYVWDAETGEQIHVFRAHPWTVTGLCFTADGHRIVSAGQRARHEQAVLRWWDAATGELLFESDGHGDSIPALAMAPDGRAVVTGSVDGTIRRWDAETGRDVLTMTGHAGGVTAVAFSPDGGTILSSGWDRALRLWDAVTGEPIRTIEHDAGPSQAVAFSPDGQRIASATRLALNVWDVATGKEEAARFGHRAPISSIAFMPDGTRMISGSQDTTIRVWDAALREEPPVLRGHTDRVRSVRVHPDGRRVISASRDGTIRVWDAPTGQVLMTLTAHAAGIDAAALSADGRRIASGGRDGLVRIWDTDTGDPVRTLEGHQGVVFGVAFSPDDHIVASGSWDGSVMLRDAESGRLLSMLAEEVSRVNRVCFSRDGRHVLSAESDHTVALWEVGTGRRVRVLSGHTAPVLAVVMSPDGSTIASGGNDQTVRLWEAATGEPRHGPLRGHASLVESLAFSHDGHRLASGDFHGRIVVWDVETGEAMLTLRGHDAGVLDLAFSPDDDWIVSASNDHTLRIWDTRSR